MPNELSDGAVLALAATAECCGSPLSKAALAMMATDLADYPERSVMAALQRCRRELSGRLSLAAIVDRIEGALADGWPTPNEAWAAVGTLSEARTLVCVEEAFTALREVVDLMKSDEVAARMAFMDAYKRLIGAAKADGRLPEWRASLGQDKAARKAPLLAAVEAGRLPASYAENLLDEPLPQPRLAASPEVKALAPGITDDEAKEQARAAAAKARREHDLRMEENARNAAAVRSLLDGMAGSVSVSADGTPAQKQELDMAAWEKRNLAS